MYTELDTTEHAYTHTTHLRYGASQVILVVRNLLSMQKVEEMHGNPLQYSCLENPMDKIP